MFQTKLLQEPVFAHCGVEGEAKNYDDIFSSYLLLYREMGGVVKIAIDTFISILTMVTRNVLTKAL